MDCFDNIIEIIAVSGDNRLGGSDFDEEIARQFCKENDLDFDSLSPQRRGVILDSACRAKCVLSEKKDVTSYRRGIQRADGA